MAKRQVYYIGMDLGKDGAIVSLDSRGHIVDRMLLSSLSLSELRTLAAWCFSEEREVYVYIEEPGFYPKWSKVAHRVLAEQVGWFKGVFHSAHFIPPKEWQKLVHVPTAYDKDEKDPKVKSLASAKFYWPEASWVIQKANRGKRGSMATREHDGLVDAALLAQYGYSMETMRKRVKIDDQ